MDEKINLLLELVSTALDELYSKDKHLISKEYENPFKGNAR